MQINTFANKVQVLENSDEVYDDPESLSCKSAEMSKVLIPVANRLKGINKY